MVLMLSICPETDLALSPEFFLRKPGPPSLARLRRGRRTSAAVGPGSSGHVFEPAGRAKTIPRRNVLGVPAIAA